MSIYEKYKEKAIELLKEGMNSEEIARILCNPGENQSSIARRIRKWRDSENIEIEEEYIDVDTEKKIPYQVVGGDYVWKTQQGSVRLPVSQVDRLFFEYSKHGQDLSQTEVKNKHNLQTWEWNSLKSRLGLTKLSNIFSPHTIDNTPVKERESMIESKMNELHSNTGHLVERIYRKTLDREAKKSIHKMASRELFFDTFITEFSDLPKLQTINIVRSKTLSSNIDNVVITIADPHIGAKTEGLRITSDYNSEISKQKFLRISDIINDYKAANVTLALMGDYIESFTGLNHANSWQSMEHGVYGAKAYWNAVDILTGFIGNVSNVANILGVSGNHDRGDSRKDVDPRGEIGLLMLENFKRMYSGRINVEYDPLVVSKEIDGISYIIGHGDDKFINGKASETIVKYGNNKMYNVVLSAHLHTFKVLEDTATHIRALAPSIFTGNYYSESSGFSSQGGILAFSNNGHGIAQFDKKSI